MQEPPLAVQPPASPQPQSKGLAITSMVLGIISVTCLGLILGGMIYRAAGMMLGIISVGCLGPISGVLAVITGGNAYNRRLKAPEQYGGAGFAIAGFVMGGVRRHLFAAAAAAPAPAPLAMILPVRRQLCYAAAAAHQ